VRQEHDGRGCRPDDGNRRPCRRVPARVGSVRIEGDLMNLWLRSRRIRGLARCAAVSLALMLAGGLAPGALAATEPTTFTGSLPDGAAYLIQVPANWNGTLVLYSHGIVIPGDPNPAQDVGDPLTGQYLLSHGYALAGSSYATTGWAVQDGLADQIATLDVFDGRAGRPARTIAWDVPSAA
jgi:hypothetical protein